MIIKIEEKITVKDYIVERIPENCKWAIDEEATKWCYRNIDLVDFVEITEEEKRHLTMKEFKLGIPARVEKYTLYTIHWKRKMKPGTFGYDEKDPYIYSGRR